MRKLTLFFVLLASQILGASVANQVASWPLATDGNEANGLYTLTNNGPVPFVTVGGYQGAGVYATVGPINFLGPNGFNAPFVAMGASWGNQFYAYLTGYGTVVSIPWSISVNTGAGGGDFYCYWTASTGKFSWDVYGSALTSTNVVTLNTWHRYNMTWDGTTRRLYIDGNLEASDTNTATISGTVDANLRIGTYAFSDTFPVSAGYIRGMIFVDPPSCVTSGFCPPLDGGSQRSPDIKNNIKPFLNRQTFFEWLEKLDPATPLHAHSSNALAEGMKNRAVDAQVLGNKGLERQPDGSTRPRPTFTRTPTARTPTVTPTPTMGR